jgi:hypothetical protein
VIAFDFTNEGSQPYLPAIAVLNKSQADPYTVVKGLYTASGAVKPGQHGKLFGDFYFRGSFRIENLLDKKPLGRSVRVLIY